MQVAVWAAMSGALSIRECSACVEVERLRDSGSQGQQLETQVKQLEDQTNVCAKKEGRLPVRDQRPNSRGRPSPDFAKLILVESGFCGSME
jgi:hypothetical protein